MKSITFICLHQQNLVVKKKSSESVSTVLPEILLQLDSMLSHLSSEQNEGLVNLINHFPSLFGDIPTPIPQTFVPTQY